MIKLTNLNKYFNKGKSNEIHVINNATLELPDHGIVTFFGHSGSGKTTLLNAIGGLDSFKGEIQFNDKVIKNYKMGQIDAWRSKHVGYVFQNYDLLQSESVYENLAIALSIIGINDRNEVKTRIEYALNAVGLYKYRKKKAYALSGGQMQRVAIARALVKKCDLLIADEPTGNLDSANTIEVMNVLKAISKNTLVLLVTHEKNIADFYSDQIIEMADGKILSVRDNDSREMTIQEEHSNAVYLGDMDKLEQDGEALNLTIYREPGDESKNHIDVFIKNGTLYIRGDTTIRLANDSSLKVIDGKRKTIASNDEEPLTYDNSFYDDTKKGHRGIASFGRMFRNAWSSVFSKKKRTIFLYICMAFMGIVFAIASAAYVNNTQTDSSSFAYSDGYYGILNASWRDTDQILDAYDKGYITGTALEYGAQFNLREDVTFTEYIDSAFNCMKVPFDKDKVKLKYGRGVTGDNDLVISENLAKTILKEFTYKTTVEKLIGKTVTSLWRDDERYTIVGISQNDRNIGYVSHRAIVASNLYYDPIRAVHLTAAVEEGHYSVIKGRDVNKDATEPECLISNSMTTNGGFYVGENYFELNYDTLKFDGSETFAGFTIVGTYELKHDVIYANNGFITNEKLGDFHNISYEEYVRTSQFYTTDCHYLVEGREPKTSKEIVVDAYSKYSIGDKALGYNVVGRISGGPNVALEEFFTSEVVSNILQGPEYCMLETDDVGAAKNFFSETYDMTFDTVFNIQYREKLQSERTFRAVFFTIFAVSFIVAGIFIFFIMRSRMLTDIYTIGVYRSLGAKRWSIVSKYMLESGILTFMFTILGYTLGCLVYSGISALINGLFGTAVAMTSLPTFIAIGFIIFAISTFVGTLPIVTLFLRTPAQIKSKYDI